MSIYTRAGTEQQGSVKERNQFVSVSKLAIMYIYFHILCLSPLPLSPLCCCLMTFSHTLRLSVSSLFALTLFAALSFFPCFYIFLSNNLFFSPYFYSSVLIYRALLFLPTQAYTIEGDQILAGRFYANKKRPLGIIKESVDTAIE